MKKKIIRLLFVSSLLESTSVFAMELEGEQDKSKSIVIVLEKEQGEEVILPNFSQAITIIEPQQGIVTNRFDSFRATAYRSASSCVSQIGYGLHYIGSSAYILVNHAYEAYQKSVKVAKELNQARISFEKGIDLYPCMKDYYNQPGSEFSGKIITNSMDFYNNTTIEFFPATAIIMQGFASKFGPDFGMLLKNMNRLIGPKVTAQLIKKLGLTQLVGEFSGNKMLALSNPLGWGATLLSIVDMGSSLAMLAQNNILNQVKLKIKEFFAEKFDIEVLEKEREALRIESKTIQIEMDESDDLFSRTSKEKDPELYKIINKKYNDALAKQYTNLYNAAINRASFEVYKRTVLGLQNTFEKTLFSFVTDLEDKIKTSVKGQKADLMAQALRLFILGADKDSHTSLALNTLASQHDDIKEISGVASSIKTIFTKPVTCIKNIMPSFLLDTVNDFADQINISVGEAAGEHLVEMINDQYIDRLKNIQLFTPEQMQLNLILHAKNLSISEDAKLFLEYSDTILGAAMEKRSGLDALIQPMLEKVGIFAADQILILITEKLQPVIENNGFNYSVATLMTQEIVLEQNVVGKAVSTISWLGSNVRSFWNGHNYEQDNSDEDSREEI